MLAVKPKYIILDEPTTMIDSKEKDNIYNCINELKKQGYAIIFVTNNINEILLTDKIFILEKQQIKHMLNKKELIDNVSVLEKCDIKIPDIIKIILKLKEKGVNLKLKEWTIEEMINEIVKVYKNEK